METPMRMAAYDHFSYMTLGPEFVYKGLDTLQMDLSPPR